MLKGQVVKIEQLTMKQTKKMYALMAQYYDNIIEETFYCDLLKKVEVVLLCDDTGDFHGFTTLDVVFYDEHTQLLFSGDTIIEKEYWANNDLSQSWIKNAFSHADKFNGTTYWLLFTKGHKTYKFLHTFFNTFYPCVDQTTPQHLQQIIDGFMVEKYASQYQDGVLNARKDFLKTEFSDSDKMNLKNKHTAFFLEKNPNYAKGDELVCMTQIALENLNRVGVRMLGV